jgi:hypothetical protein
MSYAYPFNINGLLNNVYLVSLALSALFTCYTWPLLIPCTIPGPSWFHALYLTPLDSMHYALCTTPASLWFYALPLLPSDSMHYPCFPLILCTTPASLWFHALSLLPSDSMHYPCFPPSPWTISGCLCITRALHTDVHTHTCMQTPNLHAYTHTHLHVCQRKTFR